MVSGFRHIVNVVSRKGNIREIVFLREEEPEIVSDKMDMYLERNVCSGQYVKVEDSLKEYIKDGEQCLEEVFLAKKELLDFYERINLREEEAYISDYIDELNRFRIKLVDTTMMYRKVLKKD